MIAERSQVTPIRAVSASQNASAAFAINREWIVSAFLVLISALPVILLWNRADYLTGDSYQYLRAALMFARGEGLRDMSGNAFTVLTPLYPLLIGMAHRLFPNLNIETTARLISFAGATVALVAFYSLLRVRYSLWVSLLASVLFALLPLRVWLSLWALSEGLYVGFLMLGLAVFFYSRNRALVGGAAGVLLGLAYLTRPEAMLCFAGLVVLAFFKRSLKFSLVVCAGFLLVALPYHAWIYRTTGSLNSTRSEILLAQSEAIYEGNMSKVLVFNEANADGASRSTLRSQMTLTAIAKRYWFFARLEIQRLLYLLGPHLLVLTLLIVGVILVSQKIPRIESADVWPVVLASWLLFLPFFHVEDRYLVQVMPAFLLWLALIIVTIHKIVAARLPERSRVLAGLIPLLLIFMLVLTYGYRLATYVPQKDSGVMARNTARWLEGQKLSPGPILSQAPDLAFFSNSKHLWMANGEPENVLRYAENVGAHYIYVTSQDAPTPLNGLLLGNKERIPQSLILLHEESDGLQRSRLFELN